ncbi:19234_t:CDS:2, partial [Funneliformis geosporum]
NGEIKKIKVNTLAKSLTSFLSADLDDYINILTGSLDDKTANWDTAYENSARLEKEEVNEVKGSPRVQSDDDVYFDEEVDHDSASHPSTVIEWHHIPRPGLM